MLIRVKGGSEGIAEYLASGQKQDREFTRDELDERVILDGDLGLTDNIIKNMEKDGERYLHITLAFKEDSLSQEVLQDITRDFRQFAMSAYQDDEFNFYAEAHLPKLKSYVNRQTGDLVERKPHIHIVIPERNLLTGQNLNPFGRVEQQTKFLEAIQEHANAKYGLASPKDNRRTEYTSESEIISRYKGDLFQGQAKSLKERILSDMLDRGITDYEKFRELVAEHGATRTRNAGKPAEYLNIKPGDQEKRVNLKDYVFSREFVEKSDREKRRELADEGRRQYESQQAPRKTPAELAAVLDEWHSTRAREVKHLNSGNRKLYAAYKAADREQRRAILAEREAQFNDRFRKDQEHDRSDRTGDFRGRENVRGHGAEHRRTVAHIADNVRAAGRNIESVGRGLDDTDRAIRNVADRRTRRALEALGRRLGRDQGEDRQVSHARPTPRDSRPADNVPAQLAAEARERRTEGKAAHLAEFAKIKRELDGRLLLAHLSRTHGVIPDKYEVTKGRDGGDRIQAGTRNLNVSDFLTQEMRLSFSEAAPILRQVYAAQHGREVAEPRRSPRRELWEAFKAAEGDRKAIKAQEWEAQRKSERERRAAIPADYKAKSRAIQDDKSMTPAERKAARSIARMERVTDEMALRATIKAERAELKEQQRTPYQERYRTWLADHAEKGDEKALAELRRQRQARPMAEAVNTIEGTEDAEKKRRQQEAEAINRQLAYTVDRTGNVTYYADPAKRRAVVIDSGERVTVAAPKDAQAVETGLRLAVQKWGPSLKIEGGEEFKRQVIEAAVRSGVRVEFEDRAMNEELQRRRAELQARDKASTTSRAESAIERRVDQDGLSPEAKAIVMDRVRQNVANAERQKDEQPQPTQAPERDHARQPEPEPQRRTSKRDLDR
jgi:hypothetical protein